MTRRAALSRVTENSTSEVELSRIVRWIFVLLAALATSAGAQVRRPLPDDSARLRLEAINLLRNHDTMAFLDTARVRLVAGALRAIRRELPQLADIPAGPDWSFLVLMPVDSARPLFVRRVGVPHPTGPDSAYWSDPVRLVGIPAIDSLNRVFDVARVERPGPLGSGMLCLYFRQPVDVSVVARSYSRVPEVSYAGQQVYSGDGSRITLIPEARRLRFVFARGGGDCPAGCTEWDYYYVTYDTVARSVTLERQIPHGSKREE
jgi:hypothetical protein